MTIAERLNDKLSEKEEQIEKLEQRIEEMERQFDLSRLNWQLHRAFKDDALSQQMPFPRLEMRLTRTSKDNWYRVEWTYGLVYKHYSDTSSNMLLFIPFSQTTSSGSAGTFEDRFRDGKLELPFRDGVHIYAESLLLGLPAYIVCREKSICQKIDFADFNITEQLSKMRST